MDIASMIASAKTFGAGNYIRQGTGVLILKNLKIQSGYKGDALVAEFVVDTSSSDPAARTEKGEVELANAPGTECSSVWVFSGQNRDMMLGKAKAFFEALNDSGPEADFAADLRAGTADSQPLRGCRVGYSAWRTETKVAKKSIVVVSFSTFANTAESMKEGRARVGG